MGTPSADRLAAFFLLLTAGTGLVDAVSYLALGHVFTANMTGNIVFLGFAFGDAPGLSIARSGAALGAFVVSPWQNLSFAKTRSRDWTMGERHASHEEKCPSYSLCWAPCARH